MQEVPILAVRKSWHSGMKSAKRHFLGYGVIRIGAPSPERQNAPQRIERAGLWLLLKLLIAGHPKDVRKMPDRTNSETTAWIGLQSNVHSASGV